MVVAFRFSEAGAEGALHNHPHVQSTFVESGRFRFTVGDEVKEGEPVATLSAMKMETNIPATSSGKVTNIMVNIGDKLEGDDLIMKIE